MAKMTKEVMMEKLTNLEDKLMDFIPEGEQGTERVGILNRITAIVSGEVKANLEQMTAAFNEGSDCLAVEAEVKKQKKSAKKAKSEDKPEEEKKPKKKLPAKKDNKETSAEEPKKEKKSLSKKTKKEEPVEEKPVFEFPKTLETEEDGDFKMTKIKKLTDIEEGDLIAGDWTEEDLATLEYDSTGVLKKPKKFNMDIDVCLVLAVSKEIVYALSVTTNKMYHFVQEDVPDMNSNGMLWRVYKPVAE